MKNQIKYNKCRLLEEMGFQILHEDSSVEFNGHVFDFSATNGDIKSIIYTAFKTLESNSFKRGQNDIKFKLQELIGLQNQY